MKFFLGKTIATSCLAAGVAAFSPAPVAAYQIDCAILLCLAGGWPASTECNAAHAEFIRRITPYPIEPPLQIWRCPLGVTHREEGPSDTLPRIAPAVLNEESRATGSLSASTTLQLVGDYSDENGVADVDISDPAYDFVRSIRVYSVEIASQSENHDGDCRQLERVRLGTYGTQGGFGWRLSSVAKLPEAYKGVEGWGVGCGSVYSRAVFVDWTDYEGNYGFEQVNY
ncbi:hypothetical protein [Thioclava sp. GXIMD4215]|uniref:hypothetical protein n=1 Tax=Thioclava sp. GXIMD4215 TaxID=3131928 RepID=UPI00311B4216